jgi:hypothetical protein
LGNRNSVLKKKNLGYSSKTPISLLFNILKLVRSL